MTTIATINGTQSLTLEDVKAQTAAIGSELERLKVELEIEQRNLASATERYNTECRNLASGKGGDPSKFKTEIDRRTDKILGLKAIIGDHEHEWEKLAPLLRELELKQTQRQQSEELTRLQGIQLEKQAAFETAQKALDAAERARNAANYGVDQHRRQCELRQKRREQGLQ